MNKLPYYTLVIFNISITPIVQEISPPKYHHEDPETSVQLVCDQCPPGTYVKQHCTAAMKTECAPCATNHYSEYWHYSEECQYCNGLCKELQYVKQECNSTHNRVCECIEGWYLELEFCLRHRKCPLGFGVVQPGTPDSDTICRRCSKGFFSNETSATAACQPHTNCNALGLKMAVKGNATHDSVCYQSTEPSLPKCEIDVTLCEEALFRFSVPSELAPNWLNILVESLPGMKVKRENLEWIKQRHSSHEQIFQLLKLWKLQNKEQDVVKNVIQDIDLCEKGVLKHIGHMNLTMDELLALMQSLPGKKVGKDDVKNTLLVCNPPKQILKLLSLWRIKNGDHDTIKGVRHLKTKNLPPAVAQNLKKLMRFLHSATMYRLYQKLFLKMIGNQVQSLKAGCL
ncbi:tumor necrosis factor receptor superfamily member 11B isoform X2 [Rhinatrema bivittatum]|uniref:tumor necrosis factor receptor superfamily member 11B isoform X2 n=1 Tax=Rhinatrema bivittatum TaxID=194408 RepID=UPI00112CDAF7|nr:tumor necrosis factor receptor superfamily member 11B isoform X2 [Rhinatrema bivittatum]XP_029447795.1 tumor necrosis factor receptor superfamily member 11B isoform X2 [Rhinatrema bivittatum]